MILNGTKNEKMKVGVALLIAGFITAIFVLFVDIRPKISPDFFFGSDDPEIAETKEIARLFPAEEFLVISVESPNIYGSRYRTEIKKMTDRLLRLPGFSRVISISNGPASVKSAKDSPFWRPLLINTDESATLIIAFLARDAASAQVAVAEEAISGFKEKSSISGIYLSGMPFIVDQIRKSLVQDAKLFSTSVLILFAVLLMIIYRSPTIALGASLSGISAIFLTLIVLFLLKQPVGILTANLAIIIFVLVQSQVIYLTNNWSRGEVDGAAITARQAVRKTFPASFWCSVTTFLGFLSLLFVSAEPLRQLGVGGIVGVIAALLCCYVIFPPFLSVATRRKSQRKFAKGFPVKGMRFVQYTGAVFLIVCTVLFSPGLFKLDTDPSLFTYFEKGGEIETGLTTIDQNGGSSPLQLVVSLKDGAWLHSEESYKKLWDLHNSLTKINQVGTVLSLPALMAEANEHPLAFLIPWRQIVMLLSLDANQKVIENFLSEDRTQALFLLRMKEADRSKPRLIVIENIEKMVKENGFRLDHSGGVYILQARLATLVGSSLTTGIVSLLGLFLAIAFFITRNWRLSLAMFAAASIVPVISLGGIGILSVPLDIISAPAISVTVGLAVDALIHLALAVSRKSDKRHSPDIWKQAVREQGTGILTSTGIIFIGFLVFSLSGFPPTTRFGVIVIVGSVLAGIGSLTFFPILSNLLSKAPKE